MKIRGGRGAVALALFKNKLDELCGKAVLAHGLERQGFIAQIREYIRANPIEKIIREIKEIDSPAELRILLAAGVPGDAYEVFMRHYSEVVRRF